MPVYQYRCLDCRALIDRFYADRNDPARDVMPVCPNCTSRNTRRKFTFSVGEIFEPHFNHTVGGEVISKRDMAEKLKIEGEARYARTGIPHDYKLIDAAEHKPEDLGVTDEGMGATHDRAVAEGRKAPTGKTTF